MGGVCEPGGVGTGVLGREGGCAAGRDGTGVTDPEDSWLSSVGARGKYLSSELVSMSP